MKERGKSIIQMSLFLIIIFLENQSTIFNLKKNGNICGDEKKRFD